MNTVRSWSQLLGARVAAVALAGVIFAAAAGALAAPPLTGQALVDRYTGCWKLFNEKNWAEFGKCYGPASASVAPGLPEARGARAILDRHARPLAAAFPDVAGELQLVLASGPRLMSVALMRGTHTGPLAGPGGAIPPTGKKIGLLAAHGVESGAGVTAAREWFLQDGGTMMAQLGLSPAPARPVLGKGAAGAPKVVLAAGSDEEKRNLAAAKAMYAAFDRRDPNMSALFTDDVVDHNPSVPADISGRQPVAQLIAGFWQMSSNVKLRTETAWAAGDYVVTIGKFSGVNDGDMPAMGLHRTGKKFAVDIVEITRWKDGKLAELWPFFNGVQLATQLGLMPAPATAHR
jgi:predicted ester cyclase